MYRQETEHGNITVHVLRLIHWQGRYLCIRLCNVGGQNLACVAAFNGRIFVPVHLIVECRSCGSFIGNVPFGLVQRSAIQVDIEQCAVKGVT